MRERESRTSGALAPIGGQTIRSADDKDEVAALHFAPGKQLYKFRGIHGFAGRGRAGCARGGVFGPKSARSGRISRISQGA